MDILLKKLEALQRNYETLSNSSLRKLQSSNACADDKMETLRMRN